MGRIRTIKPSFYKHEDLYEAEKAAGLPLRLAFSGIWTVCDRDGRFHWKARTLKTDVLPYDDVDFTDVLDALAKAGFVVKVDVNGNTFGQIPLCFRLLFLQKKRTNTLSARFRKLFLAGKVCAHCESTERLEVDHVIPVSRGGADDVDNYQPLCRACNLRKGSRLEEELCHG